MESGLPFSVGKGSPSLTGPPFWLSLISQERNNQLQRVTFGAPAYPLPLQMWRSLQKTKFQMGSVSGALEHAPVLLWDTLSQGHLVYLESRLLGRTDIRSLGEKWIYFRLKLVKMEAHRVWGGWRKASPQEWEVVAQRSQDNPLFLCIFICASDPHSLNLGLVMWLVLAHGTDLISEDYKICICVSIFFLSWTPATIMETVICWRMERHKEKSWTIPARVTPTSQSLRATNGRCVNESSLSLRNCSSDWWTSEK